MTYVDVLIVERTPQVRDALAALLDGTDGLRVAGVGADCEAAFEMVEQLSPDIVLVGADLPGGTTLTRRIMSSRPTPVVVLIDEGDADAGTPLLGEGALSVQLRPRDAAAAHRFRSVVGALSQVSVVRRRGRGTTEGPAQVHHGPGDRPPVRMVAVAASTGGPVALQQLFAHLPEDLPVPVLVVQHIVVGFTSGLVSTLQMGTSLPVTVPENGTLLEPGTIYLAPEGQHLTVTPAGRARLHGDAPVNGFRPSATVLFSSLACSYGNAGMAVVLTGMGTDGLQGLHQVHSAGGQVLAQDEATSVVYGMPGAAVAAGIAHVTGPIPELAAHIARVTVRGEPR